MNLILFLEIVRDQTDFTVIGIVGLAGTGKSTVLSQLALDALSKMKQQVVNRVLAIFS